MMTQTESPFFRAGGTLPKRAPSYVQRPADDELFKKVQAGTFCYVLTPRQMGKSSLMVRTSQRLQEAGVRTAVIDLTRVGTNLQPEQWYLGLLTTLRSQLRLQVDVEAWWQSHQTLSAVQRFTDFLHDEVLQKIEGQVAIFIDEIDTTLRLDFTDDFFAAIRSLYNSRATDAIFGRLTFVLLGVANPADLIQDRQRTPFNIGEAIQLNGFSRVDARVLEKGLETAVSGQSRPIFDRIFYWTNGHPYLTQKLCLSVIESPAREWTDERVDQLVENLFLSEEAQHETNLQFVRDSITHSPQMPRLLRLYRRVYHGKPIKDDKRSLAQHELKLYGLVEAEKSVLRVRNEIYRHAFNAEWIKETMPIDWQRVALMAGVTAILSVFIFTFIFMQQTSAVETAVEERTAKEVADGLLVSFAENTNPAIRVNELAKLMELEEGKYQPAVRAKFNELTLSEKLALFPEQADGLAEQHIILIKNLYIMLDNQEDNNELLHAMEAALAQADSSQSEKLRQEIMFLLKGRRAYQDGHYCAVLRCIESAIELNPDNPATHFDLAEAHADMGNYVEALDHYNELLAKTIVNSDDDVKAHWTALTKKAVSEQEQLHAAWWQAYDNYDALAAIVATPTQAPTLTATAVPPTATATVTATAVPSTSTATTLPTATATALPPTTTATPSNPFAEPNVSSTGCYAGHSSQKFERVGALRAGTPIPVVAKDKGNDWWIVRLPNGRECWTSRAMQTIKGSTEALPIATYPPTPPAN